MVLASLGGVHVHRGSVCILMAPAFGLVCAWCRVFCKGCCRVRVGAPQRMQVGGVVACGWRGHAVFVCGGANPKAAPKEVGLCKGWVRAGLSGGGGLGTWVWGRGPGGDTGRVCWHQGGMGGWGNAVRVCA